MNITVSHTTPTLAASFTHSAAALPPRGAQFAPWDGPAALIRPPRLRPHSPIRPLRCPQGGRSSRLGAARRRLYVVRSSDRSENGHRRNRERVAAAALEAQASEMRLAPSTGAQGPNGIPGPAVPCPRMHKRGHEHRLRGSRLPPSPGGRMRFAGIDIASETHVVAIVDAQGAVELKATSFAEDAAGYQKVLALLGNPKEVLIAMEATGHYWKNLFAVLAATGHSIALVNPLRTHRFAGVDLERTKTDAIDAMGIARFAANKRPPATPLPDALAEELRELVHLRERLLQDFGDRVRQLHRLVDLGFPEFTRYVRTLDSELATAILRDYPTAAAYRGVSVRRLAGLRYDARHQVGLDLARTLIDAARRSVGQHHSATYRLQIRYACDDLDT